MSGACRLAIATLALLVAAGTLAAAPPAKTPRTSGKTVTQAPADSKPGQEQRRGGARSDDRRQPVTVDADRMERFGKESLVIFTGSVVARQANSVQYADRMEVYLDEKEDRLIRAVSTGNVKIITRDCRTGTARRAEYYDLEQRVVLIGDARVWQEDNVVTGDTITIYLAQDRSVVEGGKQERVKAVFHPRQDGKDSRPAATQSCAPAQ